MCSMPFSSANALTKALLEQMSDVAFIKDQNHRYIYGNNALADLLGIPLSKIIGFDDSQIFPPEYSQKYWAMDDRVLASG